MNTIALCLTNIEGGYRRHDGSGFLDILHFFFISVKSSIGLAGGVAAERVVPAPDWVLDYWHPLEKAQYPEYFCRRETRKMEFIQKWQCDTLC